MKKISLIFAVLCLSIYSQAQNITGQGSVTDQNMNPVSNAVITLTMVDPPYTAREFTCDSIGNYYFDFALADTVTGVNNLENKASELIVTNSGSHNHYFYFSGENGEKIETISIYNVVGKNVGYIDCNYNNSPIACWNGNEINAGTGIYFYSANNGQFSGKILHIRNSSQPEVSFNDYPNDIENLSINNNKDLSQNADFTINVAPSQQTLQFYETNEVFSLIEGDNGILSHQVQLLNIGGIRLTVVDTNANPVEGAEVLLYDTKRKWRIDSCRLAPPFYTDINGQVEINALLPQEYWFNVYKDDMHNRFTTKKTDTIVDTTMVTDINVLVRPLTENEIILCGPADNKTWITTQVMIYGTIPMQYDADSKLYHDGTWDDSNGRSGFWWFTPDETWLIYDYDVAPGEAPMVIECELQELTDSTFIGDMIFQGLPVVYYMEAVWD